MSRIHEALKKAEQDRIGTTRTPAGAGTMEAPQPPVVAPERAATKPVAEPRAATALLDALTVETLLARCPASDWKQVAKPLVTAQAGDSQPGSEEFRSLRSRLYQSRDTAPLRKVLITSPLPQEGKTYVAANLAHVIVRQRERRALLIDGDLRWSRLHSVLGTNPSPGLTEYLRGEVDELAVVQRGALENLFFIPGGKSVSNAAELIANGRLKILLDRLSPLFDWVILDSPPAVAMSDASLLAEMCDGVLMVIASGKTPFDVAQKAREQLKKFRLLGVVLNRVEPQFTGSHYYYGYYRGGKSGKKPKGNQG